MTFEASESVTSNHYALTCTDCSFETTIEGTVMDAFDVADIHQKRHGHVQPDHFVNILLDGQD